MPIKIACPKCQQKYQLPDKALGKVVKCKACGTKFKTKPPTSSEKAKVATAPKRLKNQPSADELAEFGIDGPLRKQADIFDGAGVDPRYRGLGNFAAEDPGFDSPKPKKPTAEANPYAAPVDDGLSAVLANPVLMEGRGGRKKVKTEDNLTEYKTARIGLSIVNACLITIGLIFICSFVLGFVSAFVPSFITMFQEGGSLALVGSILQIVVGSVNLLAILGLFVGQCICIAAPENGERKFAMLSVGSIVGSFVLLVVGAIIGGAAIAAALSNAGESGEGAVAGLAAIGVVFIVLFALCYVLFMASELFFAKFMGEIGRNLNSKTVQKYEGRVVKFWLWSNGLTVGGGLVVGVLQLILGLVGATTLAGLFGLVMIIVLIAGGITSFLVIHNLITLIDKTLKLLKPKA